MKILLLLLLTCTALSANPDRFRELFADPDTREEALGMLTPGTESWYFHTALDHQLQGRLKQYEATISAWTAASKRKKNPVGTEELETLEMRSVLLRYDTDPKGALQEMVDEWGYDFDDTRPDSAAEEQSLPTEVQGHWIDEKDFRDRQKQLSSRHPYRSYSQPALYRELDGLNDFNRESIMWYARHFKLSQHPRYVDLLARALTRKQPLSVASVPFKRLTIGQMDELRRKVDHLSSSDRFNQAYLAKLKPSLPADLARHPEAHAAYLAECWDYARDLPVSQISIKATILHLHLRLQQQLGNHPKEDFYTYLEMPRRHHQWIRPTKDADHYTAFSVNLQRLTECEQITHDGTLIESYLSHLLADSDKIDPRLRELIKKEQLSELHARARILAGADPETYAPILGAEAYRELREETRIEFSRQIQQEFKSDDDVQLPVLLKNTPTLLIRIYELQSRTAHQASTADIDLDGLVPHHTRKIDFEQAPAIQHLQELPMPELEGPGDWIVELVSQGISARALIRKGLITPYITRVAAGQRVRLFDEHSRAVERFTIELGSESFEAKDGVCFIPNAPNSPRNRGLILAGKLAAPIQLGSRSDHIELKTRFLLDQEQLLAGKQAKLRLRNSLTNHGRPIGFDQVENASLIMKAELLGGVTTERVIQDSLKLALSNEIEFLVPDNLLSLSLHLSATVRSETGTKPVKLNTAQSYELNKAMQSARIGMALFSPTAGGTVLELRGRNGEPLVGHPVTLTFNHVDYTAPISHKLRSDKQGRIQLGRLDGIHKVVAESSSIATTSYEPLTGQTDLPSQYLVTEEDEIRIPALPRRDGTAFVEPVLLRVNQIPSQGETLVENLTPKLKQRDGLLTVAALAPGNYRLVQQGAETAIQVMPATSRRRKLLVTDDQILPHTKPASPMIAVADTGEKTLKLQVANASPHTRVSIIGKRYVTSDWISGSAVHPFDLSAGPRVNRGSRPSAFITNRRISDEMRYIIERRTLTSYPGVMLPRPGQLLHRWTPDELDQGDMDSQQGGGGHSFGGGRSGYDYSSTPMKNRGGMDVRGQQLVLDFLDQGASIEFYLMPDPEGRIEIPMANFKGAQFLHIIASDLKASHERFVPLKPNDPVLRDRRLSRPLGAKSHHIATRSAASLAPGATAEIRNLLDADWRAFTTLEQAHQFLLGSMGSDTLRRFVFMTQWPELKEKEKLKLLADHHCHELHLFLQRKDRPFFDKHVRPLLSAKPQPQFMDDYLLERDLGSYLQISAFAKLNAAEKALLAQALPDSRKAIARELELRWQNEAPAAEAQTVLFTKTLKGADLDNVDSLGMAYIRNIRKANELLVMADGHYNLGKYDDAKRAYEKVLGIDPYNVTARRGLERVAAVKSDYFRAAYDHTRSELLSEVDAAWEVPLSGGGGGGGGGVGTSSIATAGNRSGDYAIVGNSIDSVLNDANRRAFPTVPASPFASAEELSGVPYITEKMRHIIIPAINFENTTVRDAIEFLRMRAAELDSMELDPTKKGVNFVVRDGGSNIGQTRIEELRVRNVPLEVALKYICDAAKLRYKVDNYAVTLVPQTETGEDLFTRTFIVPPDFRVSLAEGDTAGGELNPFDPVPSGGGSALESLPPIQEMLKKSGISFPEGSSVTLTGNKLLVSNSPTELDKIAQLTTSLSASPAADEVPVIGGLFDRPELAQSAPRFIDRTRTWLEANYFRHRGDTGEELIPLNRFWLELSAWDGKRPFTSPHFNSCTASDSDALMCLALLDLPFSAEAPEISVEEQSLKIKALAPMLLFYKDTRETDKIAAESPLLVRQSYHPLNEPFRSENGKQVENTHVGDFRTGTAYGLSLVITNPSGIERRIETLAQIPAGAIPLTPPGSKPKDAPTTLSTSHNLEPFGVIRLQLAFYFPSAGEYSAYPLHVAEDGTILAHAEARTLRVVDEPEPEDSASWSVIARDGSNEDVLNRLRTADPADIKLEAILWRLKDRKFFTEVTSILRKRLWHSDDIEDVFSYGILHNDASAITDMLEYDNYGSLFGAWLDCKLLKVTPAANHGWEIVEFDPLVNPRAHAFGDQARFTHDAAHEYYRKFLDDLAWKAKLSDSDQMTFTCLLLLQDRTQEAIERFAKINPEQLPDRLQYDYLHSVILFLREKPAEAAGIAKSYTQKLPPGIWQDRFSSVLTQAEEISKPLELATQPEAAEFSSLAIVQDSEKPEQLLIRHRKLENAQVRLYHIDLEILFSKDPFLSGGVDTSLPPIEANLAVDVTLDTEAESTPYLLPEPFRKGNILVAAESDNFKRLKILDSQALDLHLDPLHRTLQVFDTARQKALPKTYIKVYRELDDGTVEYHKDGYTDLRGKFDYITHTGESPAKIKRLAILVSHPQKGARTTIVRR